MAGFLLFPLPMGEGLSARRRSRRLARKGEGRAPRHDPPLVVSSNHGEQTHGSRKSPAPVLGAGGGPRLGTSAGRSGRRSQVPPGTRHRAILRRLRLRRLRLVVEIDGGVHELDEVKRRDAERQAALEGLGWTVLRFSNDEALLEPERLMEAVRRHAQGLNL